MTRWLAGVFDPSARADSSRLREALEPHASTLLVQGPLQLAYTGPASSTTGLLCLLDGFLDNRLELGTELGLKTDSSAEAVLAAGWQRWGHDLPQRMRGDFAFVVWDPAREEGLIARDQLGVRSVFLHETGGVLRFAGEIRHLLALLPSRPPPDRASVAHWLTMSRRPGSATLYEGVRRLDPGAALHLGRHGARERAYWAPRFYEPVEQPVDELALELRGALERAVGRRLDPGESTAILMSGGLDSSAVAALAARAGAPGRVSAYSAVFPEHPAVDESSLIEELRSVLRLPGITAEVRPGGLIASALESIRQWELPLRSWGDFWALPLLSAAASAGAGVTLGGDGGDELFGARSYLLADSLGAGHPRAALALARELPGAGDSPARRDLARIMGNTAVAGALPRRMHTLVQRRLTSREAPPWLQPETLHALLDSDDPLAWKRFDGPRWWAHAAHGLTRGIEETGVFEHQRRRAASAGLEARHPLFDLDVLELALRQPPLATFDRYRSRPLLRASVADVLPDSVRLRPGKAWFDSMLVDCLRGPDCKTAHGLLGDPRAELRAYLDTAALQRAMFDPANRRPERQFRWMWQMWRLISAECWLRAEANPAVRILPEGLEASDPRVILRPVEQAAQ